MKISSRVAGNIPSRRIRTSRTQVSEAPVKLVDLSRTSGLNLKLDVGRHSLVRGSGLSKPISSARFLEDIRKVLVQKDITGPDELCYEYSDLYRLEDEKVIRKFGLRCSVIIIRPDRMGIEYMKTAGCCSCLRTSVFHEVLSGEAWYILQKPVANNWGAVLDVILLKAKAGEKVVISPEYGYVLVNVGDEHLVISSWTTANRFRENITAAIRDSRQAVFACGCGSYQKTRGAAYFVFEDSLGGRFEVNPYYKDVPYMRLAYPAKKIKELGLEAGVPAYPLLRKRPQSFDFLKNPFRFKYSDTFVFR